MIDCTGSWPSIPKNCQQIERKPENYPAQGFSYESQQPPIAYMPFFLLNSSKVMTQERLFDYRLGNIFWYVTAIFLLLFFVFRQKFSTFQTFLLSIPMLLIMKLGLVLSHHFLPGGAIGSYYLKKALSY